MKRNFLGEGVHTKSLNSHNLLEFIKIYGGVMAPPSSILVSEFELAFPDLNLEFISFHIKVPMRSYKKIQIWSYGHLL